MPTPRGSIHEIDSFLTYAQDLLSSLPRSHPLRPARIYDLALERLDRHKLSNQKEDLDKAILHFTESIFLQPRSWPGTKPNILRILYNLAVTLNKRSNGSKQPEDAACAAKYLRHLRDQPHELFRFPRHQVTSSLIYGLGVLVRLEAGNVMRNIREMAVLCSELLTLDASEGETTDVVTLIYEAVFSKIRMGVPDQPLDQLIECLRLARTRKPEMRDAHFALAYCLGIRYGMTFVNDDYEEAASIFDDIIASSPPGDKLVIRFQEMVTALAISRPVMHENPEYSEEAIYRARATLTSYTDEQMSSLLAPVVKKRFQQFGSIEGLEASSSNLPLSRLVGHDKEDGPQNRGRKDSELLDGLLSKIRSNDTIDIEEAIESGRTVLASFDPEDHGPVTFYLFEQFGQILFEAYQRTKKIEYLNESIDTRRRALEFPSALLGAGPEMLFSLANSLFARFLSSPAHYIQDLDETMKLFSQGANVEHGKLAIRFQITSLWATCARCTQHSSLPAAYENALSLMQNALVFAPTLQLQHSILAKTSHDTHVMPLDYASYHIGLGQLKEAIETLERGRTLLWSEMRNLRPSTDQANPHLAHKFAAVNRELEELTKSIPPSLDLNLDNGATDDLMAADPFGRLLLKQRRLLKERDNLISQIQDLPGFDSFPTSPSFNTLRSAAASGPVIIINHSSWRSDILILLHDAPLSVVPTPGDFFGRASALKDDLLDTRSKHGPGSSQYNDTLVHVLKELYNLVGKPVIDRLRQLEVPEQSRVWWCPTSVFCSLPLHAMGPIPSDDGGEEQYFLDVYIPSYTPTLSALVLESDHRGPGLPTSGLPSLLLVAHYDVSSPDVPLSEVCKDVEVVQELKTRLPVQSLISEGATTMSALDGLRDHRFVHFICHGTLETSKPFDAGFVLHGNERLTLLDIVRSHLPAAEFAFLSACHTAELTDGSSADEALHLAAAVQYCGFRSVVGTMWAMVNEDGQVVAKHFYKSMFPRKEQGEPVPYYKRSAGALRDAVKKLRKKRGVTLERWVNFVHYGA
ncbi:CHAT domain-containing protein [Lactarius sanguifluus]|nr:CHAT domain-containing protein [Lactarius sanguifluus]